MLKRYPEAAADLRRLMRERGLPVPAPNLSQPGVSGGTSPAVATVSAAQAPPTRSVSQQSVKDGVYSPAQADRGELNYRSSCGRCHSDDLMGDRDAPALVGGAFTTRWGGQTVDDLFQTIKRTMPQEAPDTLGPAAYIDIVGFLLKSNGHPAGKADLPIDALKQIAIPR